MCGIERKTSFTAMTIAVMLYRSARLMQIGTEIVTPERANMQTQWFRFPDPALHKLSLRLILLGIVGSVAMVVWMPTSIAVSPAPTFEAPLDHSPAVDTVRIRESCPECGVVSSITQVAAGGNSGIEVTVRMKNGAHRQFVDANSTNWRVGDRMVIIAGTDQAGD